MKFFIAFIVGLGLTGALPSTALADKSMPSRVTVSHEDGSIKVVFSSDEAEIIRRFYGEHEPRDIKKGNSKSLPPGIAKNLQRGKPLPPGIAKRGLPAELRRELPAPPDGHERIVIAGKIVLVEVATQIVRDILIDAAIG